MLQNRGRGFPSLEAFGASTPPALQKTVRHKQPPPPPTHGSDSDWHFALCTVAKRAEHGSGRDAWSVVRRPETPAHSKIQGWPISPIWTNHTPLALFGFSCSDDPHEARPLVQCNARHRPGSRQSPCSVPLGTVAKLNRNPKETIISSCLVLFCRERAGKQTGRASPSLPV